MARGVTPKCAARWLCRVEKIRHEWHRCHRAEGHFGPCECRCGLRDLPEGARLDG